MVTARTQNLRYLCQCVANNQRVCQLQMAWATALVSRQDQRHLERTADVAHGDEPNGCSVLSVLGHPMRGTAHTDAPGAAAEIMRGGACERARAAAVQAQGFGSGADLQAQLGWSQPRTQAALDKLLDQVPNHIYSHLLTSLGACILSRTNHYGKHQRENQRGFGRVLTRLQLVRRTDAYRGIGL